VIEAIRTRAAVVEFEIITTVPRWFFTDCLGEAFEFYHCQTDLGLIQSTPFEHDLDATLAHLDRHLPFSDKTVDALALRLDRSGTDLVISDISPLGVVVAHKAQIPSVLVENFTWDWIYAAYQETHPGFKPHSEYLANVLQTVDSHIQTEPLCRAMAAAVRVGPISRKVRATRQQTRALLKVDADVPLVLISTGGVAARYGFVDQLESQPDVAFAVLGGSATPQRQGNVILLPHHAPIYHPDLVHASDLVVGKAGYSTIAEVFHAGVPFAYVLRKAFRESAGLEAFIKKHLSGQNISEAAFHQGDWISRVPHLLTVPRVQRTAPNGAQAVAQCIAERYLR
jgi:hypothetical protein